MVLQTVIGKRGCAALVGVLLAPGGGLLLDFQLTGLHPFFTVGLLLVSVPVGLFWTIRRTLTKMDRQPTPDYARNLALATVAGQAGCATVVLIFAALFAGLFLDSRLGTRPLFTLGLVLAAIPVSLYAMIRLMLTSVAAIKPSPPAGTSRTSSPDADNMFGKENNF